MVQRKIIVNDLYLISAYTIIGIRETNEGKFKNLQLILSELMKRSEFGIIHDPVQTGYEITEKLKITRETYRQEFSKLVKLKIICRDEGTILLNPVARTPFNSLKIIEQNGK